MPDSNIICNIAEELSVCTQDICNFFKKTDFRRFYSENMGFPSYDKIEGHNYIEIPSEISLERKTFPVDNRSPKDILAAINYCEKLGRTLFDVDHKDKVQVLSRHYMIEGSTLPIRVVYEITNHLKSEGHFPKKQKILYVKKMNINRIFGEHLYAILTGVEQGTLFSESSVITPETKGELLVDYKPYHILNVPKVRDELVKLSLIAYFTGISDLDNPYNIVATSHLDLRVIDFDKFLWNKPVNPEETLLNPFISRNQLYDINTNTMDFEVTNFSYKKMIDHFSKKEIHGLMDKNKEEIRHRIKKNIDEILDLIHLMTRFEYYNHAVKNFSGLENIALYYMDRIRYLKTKSVCRE
jgi:hypothetical protein